MKRLIRRRWNSFLCATRGHRFVNQWRTNTLVNGNGYHCPQAVCARCGAKGDYQ